MPTITSGKVLVTGANGFIAVWVISTLLEEGFSVRGTVRSESKASHLKELFKSYGDKFETVVVEDITKEGAFDEFVKDVDAIEHTASPFHLRADDPQELITPAVQGTTRILDSALKFGANVKRIVITSSTAAVLQADPNPRIFNEENWNQLSLKEVETKGREAANVDKYRASKTLAELAAWAFVGKHKDEIKFDLVVLNPPFVFGPVLHEVDDPEKLNSSMYDWWVTVNGRRDNVSLANVGSSWVDVRDLAKGHVLALKTEAAGGNRIILSEGPYKWQDWVNAAYAVDPKLPTGNLEYDPATAVHYIRYDVSKAEKIFGPQLKYTSIKDSTKDILNCFKEKKWLN